MATQWYYKSLDQVNGPLSPSQLLAKVREGIVTPDTPIRKDDSQWVAAKAVGGLFEAAGVGELQYICPFCGEDVERPPTTCGQCNRPLERAYAKSNAVPASPPPEAAPSQQTKTNHQPKGRTRNALADWLRTRFRRN